MHTHRWTPFRPPRQKLDFPGFVLRWDAAVMHLSTGSADCVTLGDFPFPDNAALAMFLEPVRCRQHGGQTRKNRLKWLNLRFHADRFGHLFRSVRGVAPSVQAEMAAEANRITVHVLQHRHRGGG